jgi:hypothetical protein
MKKRFFDKVYRRAIELYYCSFDEFFKTMKKRNKDFNESYANGMLIDVNDGTMQIVFINNKLKKDEVLSSLVHETNHLVRLVLEDVCIMPLSEKTAEAYAFYQEYLFKEFKQLLKI